MHDIEVRSEAFEDGDRIPRKYTADGDDVSPPLRWGSPPSQTRSFAVICDDPDAPHGTFVHWTAWNIKADERSLLEGLPPTADTYGVRQGRNGFGRTGYGGPSPPPGKPHRYRFHVYALDVRPDLLSGATRAELERAMRGHVLAEGVLEGSYGR